MKTGAKPHPHAHGFTLVEMIGVLAVMAILAAAAGPSALRMIERAAVRAEQDTLRSFGEQAQHVLQETGVPLTAANWFTVLAPYVSLNTEQIRYNRRQQINGPIPRVYVPDPANRRGMFISSMRQGIALPSAANLSSYFGNIWDTPEGIVPGAAPGLPAAGWGAWNADNVQFLVIERVQFRPAQLADRMAECQILKNFAEQAGNCLAETEVMPTYANWIAVLSPYIPLSTTDIQFNRYQSKTGANLITRLYVEDATNRRGMFFSSMAPGVALPSAANISTYFGNIWETPEGSVPGSIPGRPAAGWAAWNAQNIHLLVIQRVDFSPVYATDLKNIPITLTGSAGGYRLVRPNGTNAGQGATPATLTNAHPNQRLELFRDSNRTVLLTTVPVTGAATYDFNGTAWTLKTP